ncbi:MAG TPA: hypothetical protein VD701_08115 [Steroidobacteraceae bacterium]|nr:hypothetical protein [Steroidobacteraceae bacterium]
MLTRGQGLKAFWPIASAIAAVAVMIWLGFYNDGSDSGAVTPTSAADANRTANQAPLQAAVPPAGPESGPSDRTKSRVVAVGFPDGTSVTVRLLSMPHPGVRIEGGLTNLADFYRQVAPLARAGDSAAAFELARKLGQCKELLSRKDAVEPAPGQLPADPQWLDFCHGAEESVLDEADLWRQMAIDAGYYFAMQDLAREHRGTPQELEIWESLWQRGHVSALQVLKIRYSQGASGSPPDYVRAYAYTLIYSGLLQAAFSELPSPSPTQQMMLVTVEDSVRQAGSYLTPAETETAIALAASLLKDNQNCCIGRWH